MQIAKSRLYLNANATALVVAGDPQAASLYCTPGTTIPDSAAEKFGLVDGELKEKGSADNKENKPASDKEKNCDGGKGQNGGGGNKVTASAKALTGGEG